MYICQQRVDAGATVCFPFLLAHGTPNGLVTGHPIRIIEQTDARLNHAAICALTRHEVCVQEV